MNKERIVQAVDQVIGDKVAAQQVVDALQELGVLEVGAGKQEIDIIVDSFKQAFGTTKTTKWDRYAASRLNNVHGADIVSQAIKALAAMSDMKYCPTIRSVSDLETKWVSVVRFLKNNTVQELEEL